MRVGLKRNRSVHLNVAHQLSLDADVKYTPMQGAAEASLCFAKNQSTMGFGANLAQHSCANGRCDLETVWSVAADSHYSQLSLAYYVHMCLITHLDTTVRQRTAVHRKACDLLSFPHLLDDVARSLPLKGGGENASSINSTSPFVVQHVTLYLSYVPFVRTRHFFHTVRYECSVATSFPCIHSFCFSTATFRFSRPTRARWLEETSFVSVHD